MRNARIFQTASAAIAASFLAVMISAGFGAPQALAHGASSKSSSKYRTRSTYRKYKHRRTLRVFRYSRRGRAIFAHEVDLSRPGGPERFFELLNEENR